MTIPKRLYLGRSSPQEFINVKVGDWIYLVGDVSTAYEAEFVHRFGLAMVVSHVQERGAREGSPDLVFEECQKRGIEISKLREKCDNLAIALEEEKIRSSKVRENTLKEIRDYRSKHSEVYGVAMTYTDEGRYIEEMLKSLRERVHKKDVLHWLSKWKGDR